MVFLVLVIIIAVTNNSIISPSPPSTTAGEQNQQLVNTDYGQYVGNVQIKSDEIRKRCSRDTRCACSTRFFFGANWMPAIFLLLEIFLQLHLLREPGYQPRSKGDQCPLRYCESCLLLGPKGSQWIPWCSSTSYPGTKHGRHYLCSRQRQPGYALWGADFLPQNFRFPNCHFEVGREPDYKIQDPRVLPTHGF